MAAVIGPDFTLSVLERIPEAGAAGQALLGALERAARARLIQEVSGDLGRFAFVHDVVRQTIYEGLSGPRRARLHRSVAETLEALTGTGAQRAALARLVAEALEELPGAGVQPTVIADDLVVTLEELPGVQLVASGGDGDRRVSRRMLGRRIAEKLEGLLGAEAETAVLGRRIAEKLEEPPQVQPAVLAHHFVAGATVGCRSEAIAWSERAGAGAMQQFAFEEALAHFQRAIELVEGDDAPDRAVRARLLVAEQTAHGALGDVSGAKQAATRAVDDARAVGSPELMVEAAISPVWWIGTEPGAVQLIEDALAVVDEHDLSRRAALMGALAYHRAVTEWDDAPAEPLAGEAVALARSSDDPEVLADVLAWRTQARVLQGSPDVTAQQADLAELATLPPGAWHRRRGRHGWLDRIAAIGRLQVGDLAGFDAFLERVTGLGEKNQDRFLLATAAMWRGLRALLDGRLDEVEDHAAHMLRWARDDVGFAINHTGLLLLLRRDQGRLEELKPLLLAGAAQPTVVANSARSALAGVHVELDEPDEARALLGTIVATGVTGSPRGLGWPATLATLAELSARMGDTRGVEELTFALAPYTGQLIVLGPGFGCLGAADRFLAMLAATEGRPAKAERLFEAALALEESVASAPLASRTRVAHARALLRSGHTDEVRRATQLLDVAASTAKRLGMAGLMHEIDKLTGARHRSD